MRKFATVLITVALSLLGLVFSPAQANVPVDGNYNCAGGVLDGTGTKYAISNGVVSSGGGCTGAVVIPAGVTSFGNSAFRYSMLTSITIPSSVTSLGDRAFQDATALTSITIPSSITRIGLRTFQATTALTSITLPSSITSIGECAFKDSGITSITIPSGVTGATGIGVNAFENSQLTTVEFAPGSSLTGIPAFAFTQAPKLTSITIPETFTTIGNNAFNATPALTSITIPANVTSIENFAFYNSGLTTITIGSGSKLESIGEQAFNANTSLTSITIPASVKTIGVAAFSNVPFFSPPGTLSLTAIDVDPANSFFRSIDGVLFNKDATTLIQYPSRKSNTSYSIPAGVTSIGVGAFSRATNLTSVTIPASVVTIGESAFRLTTSLTSVTIPASVTGIGGGAFAGASALSGVAFSGNAAPTVGTDAFLSVSSSATAYIKSGATGFTALGSPPRWNRLAVAYIYEGVSFNSNGGTAIATGDYLGSITAPAAPTRPGYAFVGWTATDDGETTVSFPYAPVSLSAITLYAKWTVGTYDVTYDSKGGTAVTSGSFTTGGDFAAPAAPTRAGYTFAGWTATDGGSTTVAFPYAPGVIEGITLYAKWTLDTYTVSYNSKGGTAVTNSSFTVLNDIAQPTEPTRAGYVFAGWTAADGSETTVSFPYAPSETSNITLYAKWTANVNAVAYNSKGGTAVTSGSFTTGGNFAAPTAPTRAGYTFVGWAATDGGLTTIAFPYAPSATSDITLFAKWNAITYPVTYVSNGGTAVSNGSFTVEARVVLPIPPTRAGYAFAGWTATDGGETTITFPYAPGTTSGITLYAKWSGNPNAVTYDSKGGSAVTSGSFNTGGSIDAAPAEPTRAGYSFLGWSAIDGGVVVAFPYSPTQIAAITLYAKWSGNPNAVTYNSKGGSAVTNGTFNTGGSINSAPRAPTREDYSFLGWTETDGGSSTISFPYAPSATSDITLYAKWLSVPPFKPIRTVSPKISGNARQNTLLTSTTGTWSATPAAVTTLQWYRCDKNVLPGLDSITSEMDCVKISGATNSTYKVRLVDQSKYLTVLTKATNKMGSTFSTAKSVLVPKATEPVLKSAPKISGPVVKGSVLTLGAGTWSANPTPTTTMQWYRCDKPVTAGLSEFKKSMDCVKISGATKASYKIVVADQAKYLTALVTGKNSQGELVKSAKSVKIPGTKPALRTSPKISGSAKSGDTLRATDGTWSGIPEADTSIAWYRCSKAVPAGATSIPSNKGCKKISGATRARYTVKTADQGKYLTVLVKAKNEAGSASATAKSIYVKVPVVTP